MAEKKKLPTQTLKKSPKKSLTESATKIQAKASSKRDKRSDKNKKRLLPAISRELVKGLTGIGILISLGLILTMAAYILLYQQPGPKKNVDQPKVVVEKSVTQEPMLKITQEPMLKITQEPVLKKRNLEESVKKHTVTLKKSLTTKGRLTDTKITTQDSKTAFRSNPVFEIFDHTAAPLSRDVAPMPGIKGPLVAIIIDDMGFDRKLSRSFAELDSNITQAVLPGAPHGRVISNTLHTMGVEVMLHLPMEPMEYPRVNPGPGALLSSMTPDELINSLRKDLDALPHVRGVNNHMGSRLTTLSPQLHQIFTVLKSRGLFFIDSRTTRHSLCRSAARLLHVPFAQRDVFLDNIQEPAYIKRQLKELLDLAQRHGSAVGIGHPYKATYAVLKEEMSAIKAKVTIVPASTLVDNSG